ncbi:MAG: bidirectional hydrogenase complex protein HoxE [Vicinamibacterales bacterium]
MPGSTPTAMFAADTRLKQLDAAMKRHRHQPDALIEILHTAQELFGYLDIRCLKYIGHALKVPPSRVYGVATFYHLFTMTPHGAHTCVVCTGTACYVNGADALVAAIERSRQVPAGGTTADGQLTLSTTRCIGTCGLAPALVIDGAITGGLTTEAVLARLARQGTP